MGIEDHLINFAQFNNIIGVEQKYQVAERFGVR
mgnify:CR=1 FL=1